ncbi:MAG TPA: porin [Terriglobales bacterium]|nr:porin [Terriglobales bacterium]
MKRILVGTSALVGVGLIASPAFAADGIKLGLGGFFRTSIDANIDNNGNNDLGNGRDSTEVTSDAEIYFLGKTTLDNGLTVGARVELEGEQKTGDQIDAAFVYFQGGFGELRIGSQNSALAAQCVTPVGGTSNFGAFSQDTINNNAFVNTFAGSATVCEGVDSENASSGANGKAQKIVYLTPSFGGFQLGLSWTPNDNHESGNGHITMNADNRGDQKQIVDAYLSYNHDFDAVSVQWGGGGSWSLDTNGPNNHTKQFYQTGLNLTFGQFAVGGAFEYMRHIESAFTNDGAFVKNSGGDMWVAGGGLAYTVDAWTIGAQYSYSNIDDIAGAQGDNRRIHQAVLTGQYALGPGISLDAELGYAHANGDGGDGAHGGYNSYNIGLGTAFTF